LSNPDWRRWLAFRNYLRAHPEVADEYGRLKTALADLYGSDPNQRDAYRSGKSDWIRMTTARALSADTG
jgi:GrpB-like predicted nucleotidyltransferase (UPF0157 family)